jgi:hypothetical protein
MIRRKLFLNYYLFKPMLVRIGIALVFAVFQVYFVSETFTKLDGVDTSFVPRTLMVSTSTLLLLTLMWPSEHGTMGSLYYLFWYVMMYAFLVLMYVTKEPIIALFVFFSVVLAIGQAIRKSPTWSQGYTPVLIGFFFFLLSLAFFSHDSRVDELVNGLLKRENIDKSRLPVGYLSGDATILASPLVVSVIMGLFAYGYVTSAYRLREEPATPVSILKDTREEGY